MITFIPELNSGLNSHDGLTSLMCSAIFEIATFSS